MLDIEYKGGNTVIISTKNGSIVTDPRLSVVGLKDIDKADMIELATEERFKLESDKARVVIDGPGDYGVADFDIHGVAAQRHLDADDVERASTMYRIQAGEIRVALLGNVFENLSEEQIEELGVVDVLIVPVGGGGYTLDAIGAAKLTAKIGPKVVIPIHYSDSALTYEVTQADVDEFTKELGVPVETVGKLKIKGAMMGAGDALKVVILERS